MRIKYILLILVFFFVFAMGVKDVTAQVIADHTKTDLSKIPDEWIERVKDEIKVYYGHASHGEQIICGLQGLSDNDSKYAFAAGDQLPDIPNTLCFLSTYNDPDMFFSQVQGYLDANPSINVAMFSWCGEASWYDVNEYIAQMEDLEAANPDVTFVYMTGNAQEDDCSGCGRYRFNETLRQYCRENNKVLFDFADLDVWYNDQQHTYDCPVWCECAGETIPLEHPQYDGDECGHTTMESCDKKGKATWWMLARILGWDGGSQTEPPNAPSNLTLTAVSGDQIELSWTDNSNNEEGFYLYRSTTDSKPAAPYHTNAVDDNTKTDTGLSCETAYYYWIEAFNGAGSSSDISGSVFTESCISNQAPVVPGLEYIGTE